MAVAGPGRPNVDAITRIITSVVDDRPIASSQEGTGRTPKAFSPVTLVKLVVFEAA
jgi:hypothetical protein